MGKHILVITTRDGDSEDLGVFCDAHLGEILDGSPLSDSESVRDADDDVECQCCRSAEKRERQSGPPMGTFVFTARMMAEMGMMTGDEADRWKDEMKEGPLE